MQPLHSRFWSKIDCSVGPDSCWLWVASVDSRGYGQIGVAGKLVLAHRLAYELEVGPPGALCVLHRCDVPRCCNPKHLFLGTKKDNSDDMIAKGRARKATGDANASRLYPERRPRGEKHHGAKLTREDVLLIRSSAESGPTLAKKFGVDRSNINCIRRGDTWRDVA